MSDSMDPSKLKVAELRAELQSRGLDTKGNKPVLVERLKEALEAEASGQDGFNESVGRHANDAVEGEEDDEDEEEPQQELEEEPESEPMEDPEGVEVKDEPGDSSKFGYEEAPVEVESVGRHANDAVEEEEDDDDDEEEEEEEEDEGELQQELEEEPESDPMDDPEGEEVKDEPEDSSKFGFEEAPVEVESVGRQENDAVEGEEEENEKDDEGEENEDEDEPQQELEEEPESEPMDDPEGVEVKDEPEDSSKFGYEEAPVEVDVKTEQDNGFEIEIKEEVAEIKQEVVPKEEPVEAAEVTEGRRRGEKRPRSRSRSPEAAPEAKKSRPEVEEVRIEDEPDFDKTVVALDWYNSDLSLVISKDDFISAQPLTMQGFGYVWHGVRATYGFTHGRVFFEAKVEDYLPVPQLEEEEQHPHVLRAGWSINDAGLTLGEDPLSYGYGGTGKASTNLRFKDYGKQFGKGDVVGCFLDLESEPIIMSYTVNGEHQGIAYEIPHDELEGQALFPHIVTKNTSFKVNFGTQEAWFQPLTGYTFVGTIPLEERVLGTQGPERREDAEVIMMVGLPGAGKTTWVEKYTKENLEKKYYVLGTNFLIDKMKVNGLPRRRNYRGRWEVLIERCTKCLNKLLELSYKRRRNFIIDQTNVYPSAQRRKMKGFAGFKRRAVVICPTDEDLKKRTDKREREEGKDIPDKAVLEMKANFKLPEEAEIFDKVEFIEVQREESQKLVEQYNKEGEDAGFGQKKGFRGGFGDRRGGFMDRRGGYGNRGGRGGWDRDRRGGYSDRRERSSWSRDRDSRDYNRSGSYNRESRGSFNRDYNRGSYNNRDSRGSYNRDRGSRSGTYQSNWNRNSSNEIKTTNSTTTTNPWATQQGSQSSQGYGNYSSYNSQGSWGNQGYGYGQGYGNNTWNQQYYQQQQQQQQQQPQQQYWGTGYSYGSQGYGTSQQYGTGSQSSTASGSWAPQSSSWSGTSQQWGSTYKPQQWGGTGYGSGSQSSQRR